MGELFSVLHSTLLQLHQTKLGFKNGSPSGNGYPGFAVSWNYRFQLKGITAAGVVSSGAAAPPTVVSHTVGSAIEGIGFEADTGGSGGDKFDDNSGAGGGGGGGDNSGGGGRGDEGEGEAFDDGNRKKMEMSMSQKFTLGYAALLGLGGFMGYMKSGSQKSLLAGGLSASLLCYVYTELPARPVLASSLGLGVSSALLVVMGSRFKRSGKVFPAGVVSLVSLAMTGGYLHGIMRSLH
ncbi:hypothetical protein SLEP1_g15978 [Rubroshorea leprosula]|uniref:Uncharacterized protein n=1 Tax=Rubroshorea leprosula TaxID=152421 RepID=A0AAV5IWZ2_9ROSI|nr:hypothetical protein SLEP1_g15978 [Rubroshorea leprosula]